VCSQMLFKHKRIRKNTFKAYIVQKQNRYNVENFTRLNLHNETRFKNNNKIYTGIN